MKHISSCVRRVCALLLALLMCTAVLVSCDKGPGSEKKPKKPDGDLASGKLAVDGEGEITWSLTVDGLLTVSGSGSIADYTYQTAPFLQYAAFIRDIVVENGITGIGDCTFYLCISAETIRLPDTLQSLGKFAIRDCPSLLSVTIPPNVREIGDYCFIGDTALERIEVAWGNADYKAVGNCLLTKDGTLLAGCKTSVIPDGVTTLGGYCFYGVTGLTGVTIPESVTSIGRFAFSCTGLNEIEIPAGVTELAPFLFEGCTELQKVILPDTLLSIGEYVFNEMDYMPSVTIPDSVVSIDPNAFFGVENLSDIYYGKTMADWEATGAATENWAVKSALTVHCADGDISVSRYSKTE